MIDWLLSERAMGFYWGFLFANVTGYAFNNWTLRRRAVAARDADEAKAAELIANTTEAQVRKDRILMAIRAGRDPSDSEAR